MAYNSTPLIGIDVTSVNSNPQQQVGVIVEVLPDQTYQYVYAGAALTNGTFVHIGLSGTANPATPTLAATAGDFGFSQQTMASGQYGWVARKGSGLTMLTLTACAASVALWTTDTAGVLDDAVNTVSQFQVMGATLINSNSAGATVGVLGTQQAFPIIRRNAGNNA